LGKTQGDIGSVQSICFQSPCERRGCTANAHRAWEIIKKHLTEEEITKLGTARSHAIDCGEGRGEHDALCKKIREDLVERLLHGE
jgi:hypothetical protein